jgi:GTP-binding protein
MIRRLAKVAGRRALFPFPSLMRRWYAANGIGVGVAVPSSGLGLGLGQKSEQEKRQGPEERSVKDIFNTDYRDRMRNVAIIAHVDHGKTTLVDCLMKNSGISVASECAMDMNDQEKERGITILAKCTSILYRDHKINIVDTPGHHDFGGEVERILSMVDGVILVVCANEGPMPQTKFVLQKALHHHLQPIVVVNKADRETSRIGEVENDILDLFCSLEATDKQLDYPLIYASAKLGWSSTNPKIPKPGVEAILNTVLQCIPPPKRDPTVSYLATL